MKLSKWYFDCVTPQGDAFIGYSATLRLFGLRLSWSASRLWTERERLSQGFSRHSISEDAGGLRLSIPRFRTEGVWEHAAKHPPLVLEHEKDLSIRWQVLRPRTASRVRINGHAHHGAGYAERLDIELAKPLLPFDELHWGRFFPDSGGYCIWIGWRGGLDRNWVLTSPDGADAQSALCRDAYMTTDSLRWQGGVLSLAPGRILADNSIGSHIPAWLRKPLGGPIIAGHEQKFLSRGSWQTPQGESREGWALHETVRWPR